MDTAPVPEATEAESPGAVTADRPDNGPGTDTDIDIDRDTDVARPKRRHWLRVLAWTAAVIATLAVVIAGVTVWAVRRPFPDYTQRLTLPGLGAEVSVVRDRYGIPQLYAQTDGDLFRAQGYVHAQERFWEMDFRRHVTAGRVAEMFGESQVKTDTYIRTLGWRRVAEAEWPLISADTRAALTAYADGVNAWLVTRGVLASPVAADGEPNGTVSLEYSALALTNSGYRIERWTPVDSLAWLKAMAWDLRGNMGDELDRSILLGAGLTREQVEQLHPPYPYDTNGAIVAGGTVDDGRFSTAGTVPDLHPAARTVAESAIRSAAPVLAAVGAGAGRLPELLGANGGGIGSNSWVIGGERSATGKPILANDPHLGPSLPGIWMQMGLHCACGTEVAGFTFSGVPGVIIGHNARVAWGFTNLPADVTDFYLERVDGDRYQVGDGWQPMQIRHETITVAGGELRTITIRSTRHGPVLSDASAPVAGIGNGNAVSLRWTALDPGRTADALLALNRATDWTRFRQAAELFEVPAQNLVYADVDGNIGYQMPGRIPVRGKGDGKWPNPGWDTAYDWTGFIPFDELPTEYNPPSGVIVTANNAVAGPSYQRFLSDDWSYGYRAKRIRELIGTSGKLSVDDMQRMQFDNSNTLAAQLVPALLAQPLTGTVARAQALLRDWDYQQGTGSAPAAYFNAVWLHLLLRTFDEVPSAIVPTGGDRWYEVMRSLLSTPDSPWWDDRRTPAVESMPDILRAAMTDASAELTDRLGDDPTAWRWGAVHTLTLRSQTFGTSGIAPIEWLFNASAVQTAGGTDAVNATSWTPDSSYDVNWVPSMRMIVDLADLDRSRWVCLTGVSGHAFSEHYTDQLELWRTGRTTQMPWTRPAVDTAATTRQTLQP